MSAGDVRFDGRAIVVTGAGRGMGREHALLLASRGAQVVVSDAGMTLDGTAASRGPADTVVSEIEAAGGKAVACPADLSTNAGSADAIQTCIDAFGRVDGVLHNASIFPQSFSPDALPDDLFDRMMRVNVYAGFWLTRAAWPHMKRQGGGRIVYTASHAIYGVGTLAAYSTAKSAFIGMCRSFAGDGEPHNILCNLLVPTARTRMTDEMAPSAYTTWLNEAMDPAKIAIGAAYLLSDECKVTGEMLSVAGGRIARVQLGEAQGIMGFDTIEQVRDQFDEIVNQRAEIFPKNTFERTQIVHKAMGFDGTIAGGVHQFAAPRS